MDSSTFPLESDLNSSKQDTSHDITKETASVSAAFELGKDVTTVSKIDSVLKLPGLGNESPSHYAAGDLQLEKLNPEATITMCKSETDENNLQMSPSSYQVKRSLSPQPSCSVKTMKTESSEKTEMCIDMLLDEKLTVIKKEESTCDEKKAFMMDILKEFVSYFICSFVSFYYCMYLNLKSVLFLILN